MSRGRVGHALLLAALVSLLAATATADSRARIVRLSYVDGTVEMDHRDGQGFERAVLNLPVAHGDRLATRGDSFAEVEFEAGSTLRLTPRTRVEFTELTLRSSGQRYTVVELQEGAAYFNHEKKDGELLVEVGQQQFHADGAARFRVIRDRGQVRVAVFKGELDARNEQGAVRVKKNETFSLDLDSPDRYHLARGVDEDQFDDWDGDRESYRDRYASGRTYSGYSSAYSYGYSDLNYWGSFFNAGGWGTLWRPYYIPASWSPFSDGAWVFYPGWGWTWVSAYPWGWTPYRYGQWVYIGGYGWCWRPGRSWNVWHPYTSVHNPPSWYVAPRPPQHTGGTAVKVVPVGSGPTEDVRRPRVLGWKQMDEDESIPRRRRETEGSAPAGAVAQPATSEPGTPAKGVSESGSVNRRGEEREARGHRGSKHVEPEPAAVPAVPATPAQPAQPGVAPATPATPATPAQPAQPAAGERRREKYADDSPRSSRPAEPPRREASPPPARQSAPPPPRPSAPPPSAPRVSKGTVKGN